MKSKYVLLDAVITVISGQTFTINQFSSVHEFDIQKVLQNR